ncbi:MAG: hypothetical protein JWP29_4901 [Rhodoferax sp.]|nr:hypothetical protein [Rhodoferax sp.]
MKLNQKLLLGAALGSALALTACGGGGGGGNDDNGTASNGNGPGTFFPDSASASVDAFIAYLLGLSTTDETSGPLLIRDNFNPPVDDVNAPKPLG